MRTLGARHHDRDVGLMTVLALGLAAAGVADSTTLVLF
jgi:hypothetical protein